MRLEIFHIFEFFSFYFSNKYALMRLLLKNEGKNINIRT